MINIHLLNDGIRRNVFSHQQRGDANAMILEEDLPNDIVDIVTEVDYAKVRSTSTENDNNKEQLNDWYYKRTF